MKIGILVLAIICIVATGVTIYLLGGIESSQIQALLNSVGIWSPIIYIALYVIATILVFPSTVLNLTGGAVFGAVWGTLWTSLAAIIAAVVAFTFTRTVGREIVAKRLSGRWQTMDAEVRQGGLFYMFAIRLVPIMPYGLVNFAAGLTSISLKDYILGTTIGTVPSVLPFVLLGSSGLKALHTGDVLPLVGALALTSILVGGVAWYRRRRILSSETAQALQKSEEVNNQDLKER